MKMSLAPSPSKSKMATPVPVLSRMESFSSWPPKVLGTVRPDCAAISMKWTVGASAAAASSAVSSKDRNAMQSLADSQVAQRLRGLARDGGIVARSPPRADEAPRPPCLPGPRARCPGAIRRAPDRASAPAPALYSRAASATLLPGIEAAEQFVRLHQAGIRAHRHGRLGFAPRRNGRRAPARAHSRTCSGAEGRSLMARSKSKTALATVSLLRQNAGRPGPRRHRRKDRFAARLCNAGSEWVISASRRD